MTIDTPIHRNLLLRILKKIYTDTTLGPILGFKGGTAVYLFYNLPRFSVDLDFDLLDKEKEDFVYEKIEAIIKGFGTIKTQYKKRNTLFFILAYDDVSHNIKVEISRRGWNAKYELKNYLGVSMLVMSREDMFANKLVALLDRSSIASRDIYDVWFFLNNQWQINKDIVEGRTGMNFKEYIEKCIKFIEGYENKHILHGMGELLSEKQKIWAKEKLKDEVVFLLKLMIDRGN